MTTAAHTGMQVGPLVVDVPKSEDVDRKFYSVTTILNVIHKEAIVYWACEQTANAAINEYEYWQSMLKHRGRDETMVWLRDARYRPPQNILSDTAMGTIVHDLCEYYVVRDEKPGRDYAEHLIRRAAEVAGKPNLDIEGEARLAGVMLNHFDGWLQRFTPSYQGAEISVYNTRYGYAGTTDAFLTVDLQDGSGPVRFEVDYKSSRKARDRKGKPKKPYPEENALQLAAYRNAEFAAMRFSPRRFEQKFSGRYYLLSPDEYAQAEPIPEVDTGLIIHITPEGCEAYPMDCAERYNEDGTPHRKSPFHSFLHALELFRWCQETSHEVMGDPLL
jgi:hypothetical protein